MVMCSHEEIVDERRLDNQWFVTCRECQSPVYESWQKERLELTITSCVIFDAQLVYCSLISLST